MLRAVRGSFPDTILHIDCNAGYTLDDLDTFKTIDQFRLAFLEQPLQWDDVVDHAELSRQIETPICLDESARELRTHPAGPGNQRLSVRQHQARTLRRPHPFTQNPRYVS